MASLFNYRYKTATKVGLLLHHVSLKCVQYWAHIWANKHRQEQAQDILFLVALFGHAPSLRALLVYH